MIRRQFLETGAVVNATLRDEAVIRRWDDDSALAEYTVAGLAGHLARAVLTVGGYLELPASGPTVSAATYFATGLSDLDPVSSDAHRSARTRGLEAATDGPVALADEVAAALAALRSRLGAAPATRAVTVFGGLVLTIDDYLVTRLVEMVVHLDDLTHSVGLPFPPLPAGVMNLVLHTLGEIARLRHDDLAVLRAFSRRERITDWPHAF